MIHNPEILILDEPTSGVDPIARDNFWWIMIDLARRDNVTIFISTHLMNEAKRCDRISLMHAGEVLASGSPKELMERRHTHSLEEAFISYLREAAGIPEAAAASSQGKFSLAAAPQTSLPKERFINLRRLSSYMLRETMELRRDPIRLALSLLGSVVLMMALGFGVSMDVENLSFAVLDRGP